MRRSVFGKILLMLLLVIGITFISCEDDKQNNDFKKGREVYMSNDVTFHIVFPETQDTILYKDITSGFTVWVQNNKLSLQKISIKGDSVTYTNDTVKHAMSLDVSFKDAYIYAEAEGKREVGCGGEAILRLDSIETSLKFSPLTGYLEGDKSIILFSEMLPEDTKPYLVMRSKGVRIHE